jgi:hypothetical protein
MSTIKVGTLLAADGSTTTQPSIPALDTRMAKAWVNFNGNGTVAIRDSYNVSSITDAAAGNYRVNFATAMANNDYSAIATDGLLGMSRTEPAGYQTGLYGIYTANSSFALADTDVVSVVFGS